MKFFRVRSGHYVAREDGRRYVVTKTGRRQWSINLDGVHVEDAETMADAKRRARQLAERLASCRDCDGEGGVGASS